MAPSGRVVAISKLIARLPAVSFIDWLDIGMRRHILTVPKSFHQVSLAQSGHDEAWRCNEDHGAPNVANENGPQKPNVDRVVRLSAKECATSRDGAGKADTNGYGEQDATRPLPSVV